jgi:hypothetical protein
MDVDEDAFVAAAPQRGTSGNPKRAVSAFASIILRTLS